MRNLHFFLNGLTTAILAALLVMAVATPSAAQAGQPAGGKVLYLRDEAACASTPTLPSAYPLPDAQKNCDAPQTLVVAGADGRIVREVRLPVRVSSYVFSPDGAWVAYHTGEAGGCEKGAATSADLALNLLNIQTGESKLVTKLLRADYPQNFNELAPNADSFSKLHACMSFDLGIRSLAWSSDGARLAFAGEMDGPSSDLYLLTLASNKIDRLTDGPENIREINWSPDNRWIEHSSNLSGLAGDMKNLHFASVDGSVVYSRGGGVFEGWVDNTTFIRGNCAANCLYDSVIEKVNFVTGKKINLLPKNQEGWVTIDAANHTLALVNLNPPQGNATQKESLTTGLALIDAKTLKSQKVNLGTRGWYNATFVGKGDVRMFLGDIETPSNPIYMLHKNGSFAQLSPNIQISAYQPHLDGISPDGKYFVIPKADGLYVYRISDGMLVRSIKMDVPQPAVKDDDKAGVRFFWPSQSAAFVKVTQPGEAASKLYALDFLYGQPQLVDSGLLSGEMVVGK